MIWIRMVIRLNLRSKSLVINPIWRKKKLNAETIKQLQKVSTPKTFEKDEYICYEGQPGNEMYIILKGLVGVNLTSTMGTLTEVAQLHSGDFFGEMAIFDNLPRSASCIALEDTICVAINQENIMDFLTACPEMTAKILEHLSARIRKLNNDLYKNPQNQKTKPDIPRFAVPVEYGFSHMVKEPYQEPKVLTQDRHKCPICGVPIRITDMKRHLMKVKKVGMDCRIEYLSCEPLWYDIFSCPHCGYANHHVSFFKVSPTDVEQIQKILEEEHMPILRQKDVKRSDFDMLVLKYLQAIHLNEHIHGNDNTLIGSLWLKLYWLAKDSGDEKFAKYCAINAAGKIQAAVDNEEIEDKFNQCMMALSLANLLELAGEDEAASNYSAMALDCPNEKIVACANEFRDKLSKKMRKKM